jgi:hypothetical protein
MSLSLLSRYAFFAVCVIFTLASLPFLATRLAVADHRCHRRAQPDRSVRPAAKPHAVRRNYPILGNIRYLVEAIRPEIRQYLLDPTATPCPSPAPSARWSIPGPRTKPPTNPSAR